MSFEKLNLVQPILSALHDEGYEHPTPIQEQAIPIILSKKDILGCAQTGTGKTAAFALPIIQLICGDQERAYPRKIKSLILTPTRELAIQISESFKIYGKNMSFKHTAIFGGVSQRSQTDKLRAGLDILIATPGRLLDLMNQRFVDLSSVQIFVLDEADRMLDMGFLPDVRRVIAKLPTTKQTLFFSATMPNEISSLASSLLVNPSKIAVTPVSSTVEIIDQSVYLVKKSEKKLLLAHLLKENTISSALIFTRTKHGADKVVKDLSTIGIESDAIHGNKSQGARQRALHNFKNKQIRVLVATDIAARGIDIDELSHVINYDLPNIPETYVHRIGRTGRAGLSGTALSFCDEEERVYLKDINKLISTPIPIVEDHPFHMGNMGFSVNLRESSNRFSSRPSTRKSVSDNAAPARKSWYSKKQDKPRFSYS